MNTLLFVIEFGGFPLNLDIFKKSGYEVLFASSVRKALPLLKQHQPDLLVAEFNYTSQFRDRDSNLDTILNQLQSHSPGTRVIAFVEEEQRDHFERLRSRFDSIKGCLYHPFESSQLEDLVSAVLKNE